MTHKRGRKLPPQGMRTIAVVSGKGGSGKTMVAVSLAQALAALDYHILLIDADFGTGGLTYYLNFKLFSRARFGLADLHSKTMAFGLDELISAAKTQSLQSHPELSNVAMVPTGDQRSLEPMTPPELTNLLKHVLGHANGEYDFVIMDCRGGIDEQSLAVCSISDDVLVVAETDATSIQATQHLVDILSSRDLRQKVAGFVLNKVMDDPTALAKASTSLFKAEYLGSVPFDIDATRAYIQGDLPDKNALFSRHIQVASSNMLPEADAYRNVRTLSADQFSTVTLRSPETRFGGMLVVTLGLYAGILLALGALGYLTIPSFSATSPAFTIGIVIFYLALLVAASSDAFKQAIGATLSAYPRVLSRAIAQIMR
jgi:septum site-determining protein MinD